MSEGKKRKINVLSLFGGIECGRIALDREKIDINKYYSSEICKDAIKVADGNYSKGYDGFMNGDNILIFNKFLLK